MGYSYFQERNGDVVFFIQGLLYSLLFSLNSNYDEELSPIKFIDSEPHGDFLFSSYTSLPLHTLIAFGLTF